MLQTNLNTVPPQLEGDRWWRESLVILAKIMSVLNITQKPKTMNTQTRQSSPTTLTSTKCSTKNEQWKILKTLSMSLHLLGYSKKSMQMAGCSLLNGRKSGSPSTVILCQPNPLNDPLPKTSAIRLRNALVSEDFLTIKNPGKQKQGVQKGWHPEVYTHFTTIASNRVDSDYNCTFITTRLVVVSSSIFLLVKVDHFP